jgi:diadenosine tetraphosphatase ApaH/serine/threonine PP2A family protein phosphatase
MPNASEDEFREIYAPLNAKTVVYAHIHVPFVRHFDVWTIANTGSVGQSYDGDTRASYLVIDGENLTTRRVEYDVQAEADALLHSGVPHAAWMARILLAGKFVPPE